MTAIQVGSAVTGQQPKNVGKIVKVRLGHFLDYDRINHSINQWIYEGRSINKLQKGAILSVLKIGKIRNICFVGNLILNIYTTFLDDDVIILTIEHSRSVCYFLHLFTVVTHKW